MNRRNLSGIYYLYKFPDEDSRKPTCFEDCPLEKQKEIVGNMDAETLGGLAIQLAEVLRKLVDKLDIERE